MQIFVLSGLSFSGKTTIALELEKSFSEKGFTCVYRKGQLTNNRVATMLRYKALDLISNWNFSNKDIVNEYINLGFQSFYADFQEFTDVSIPKQKVDLIILDRHLVDHFVVSEYFMVKPNIPRFYFDKFQCIYENYFLRYYDASHIINNNQFNSFAYLELALDNIL